MIRKIYLPTLLLAGALLILLSATPAESTCTCSGAFCGTSGDDTFFGSSTNDCIESFAGDDTIYGYAGDDEIFGGSGDDTLKGGSGDDCLDGGTGSDNLDGESDYDLCMASSSSTLTSCEGEKCDPPATTCDDYSGKDCSNCPSSCETSDCFTGFCTCSFNVCLCSA